MPVLTLRLLLSLPVLISESAGCALLGVAIERVHLVLIALGREFGLPFESRTSFFLLMSLSKFLAEAQLHTSSLVNASGLVNSLVGSIFGFLLTPRSKLKS